MSEDPKPLVKNAASPTQVKKAGNKQQRVRELELNDVCFLLDCPQGRRFIWRYLEVCGVYKLSHGGPSPYDTSFREGHRNVGLKLIADVMEANPDAYITMMKENQGDKNV